MPDNRKHILVEPETHKEFMDFAEKHKRTQDSGLNYLLRFHRSVGKADKALADKINFNLS
jgi:hypothetical protein